MDAELLRLHELPCAPILSPRAAAVIVLYVLYVLHVPSLPHRTAQVSRINKSFFHGASSTFWSTSLLPFKRTCRYALLTDGPLRQVASCRRCIPVEIVGSSVRPSLGPDGLSLCHLDPCPITPPRCWTFTASQYRPDLRPRVLRAAAAPQPTNGSNLNREAPPHSRPPPPLRPSRPLRPAPVDLLCSLTGPAQTSHTSKIALSPNLVSLLPNLLLLPPSAQFLYIISVSFSFTLLSLSPSGILSLSRSVLDPSTSVGFCTPMSRQPRSQTATTPATTTRQNEYFVPRDGIDREVISADICRYLGNDALVRPGHYEVCPWSRRGKEYRRRRNSSPRRAAVATWWASSALLRCFFLAFQHVDCRGTDRLLTIACSSRDTEPSDRASCSRILHHGIP